MNSLNVKKLIVTFYIVVPALFYSFFYLLSLHDGGLNVYFFGKEFITSESLFYILMIHIFIGVLIMFLLKKTKYLLFYKKNNSISYNLIISLLYADLTYLPIPYFNDILYTIFIILFAFMRPGKLGFFILFTVSIIQLLFFNDRFPIVLMSILYFLPIIAKQSYKALIIFGIVGYFSMIFILQPLKGGYLPFTNNYFDLAYSLKHVFPILMAANTSMYVNIEGFQIFVESIPLLKGILHYPSIIDVISYNAISKEAIEHGSRIGSNSALFLNTNGIYVLLMLFFLIYSLMRLFRNRFLNNSLLLFFIIYGPYFIRRFFGSYILDIIIMIFVTLFMYIFVVIFKKLEIIKRKKYV